jgi:hypothetical protein
MKSARTLITICLLFTAATLFAQIESRPLMKANIPFSFTVDSQTLPAGIYYVVSVTPERTIRLASADGKHSAIVNDLPNYTSAPSPNSRLIFNKYGNEYFLAQVWTKGENVARNPLSSKRAMEIATGGVAPQTFTVLALSDRR